MNQDALPGREPAAGGSVTPARARRWLIASTVLGIGCAAALVTGEVMVRLVEPRPDTPGIPLPGSARLYGYPAKAKGYAGGVAFRTNSSGFRGPDLVDFDGKRDFVILVLGDSYAFGYGVESAQAFPALLETRLRGEHPGRRVRVINLGIPGYDTSQELAVLREWGPQLHPQLVLLQYHLNDIQRHPETDDGVRGTPRRAAEPGVAGAERRMHLLRFLLPRLAAVARPLGLPVKTTATAEIGDYVANEPAWQHNQQTLQEVFKAARSMGARIGVLVVPYLVALNDRHPPAPAYQAVLRFCATNGIPAVNALDYFKGHRAGHMWINAFDGHPNVAGHTLLAQAAADLVAKTRSLEVR
jgi:lysophospholipase L1-like esterase